MRLLTYHLKAPDLVRALIRSIGGFYLDRVPAVRELTSRGKGWPVRGLAVGERAVRRCKNSECNRVITFEQPEGASRARARAPCENRAAASHTSFGRIRRSVRASAATATTT